MSDMITRGAMENSDTLAEKFITGDTIDSKDLVIGEYYMMTFPTNTKAVAKLVRIFKNALGDDYVFENIHGAESLANKSTSSSVDPNEFLLPVQVLSSVKFNELKKN